MPEGRARDQWWEGTMMKAAAVVQRASNKLLWKRKSEAVLFTLRAKM